MRARSSVVIWLLVGGAACSQHKSSGTEAPRLAPGASSGLTVPMASAAEASAAEAPARASAREEPPAWPPSPPGAQSDFCIEGVEALDESTCYVLPDAPTTELLIYLHGIVPPTKTSRQKSNFENVVKAASRRARIAALMPRGRQGLAPKGHDGWWGWPTSRASYQALADELIGEFAAKRHRLEGLTGQPFRRVYLAGSSSGAYFVTALAVHQGFPADGYAIISGASDTPGVDWTQLPRRPVYIGFGAHDTVGGAARALAARIERAGFPVKLAEHPLPHGTAEVYLDEAFAHFRDAGSER